MTTPGRANWGFTFRQHYPLTDAPTRKRGGDGPTYTPISLVVWIEVDAETPRDDNAVVIIFDAKHHHYAERILVKDAGAKTRAWLAPYLDDAAAQVAAMVAARKATS